MLGSFRLDYEYEIEYEYDFQISTQDTFWSRKASGSNETFSAVTAVTTCQ